MENQTLQLAWKTVTDHIKTYENIDQSQISAFFSRLHPQAISDGFLMLSADNEFIKTWIESHYLNLIKKALFEVYKIPYTVLIEIDISQTNQQNSDVYISENKPHQLSSEEETSKEKPIQNPVSQQKISKTEHKEASKDIPGTAEEHQISTFTFENFVIGDSNRMAYSMSVAVAEMPGKEYLNPLFIYGRSGLGKTHLMRAIQNYIHETLPHLKTLYIDSAELLSDYMDAVTGHDKEKQSYKNFKMHYEEADVLLIDDVQYLQGKKQTLDIVFQIFNKLTSQGKQVVLSADRAPKNIDIDERYKSRFNSGGTFDIEPPEVETKLGIIKSFIKEYKTTENMPDFSIPEDIQLYIAENSSSNIRELKSAVTKVIYQMTFFNQPDLNLTDVKTLLINHFSGGSLKRLTVADIQKEVETFYKINHSDLIGKKRTRNIIYARQVAIYLCRQLLDLPYNDIGKKFNKDHSTIMYSVSNVEEKIKENRELQEELETLRKIIKEL